MEPDESGNHFRQPDDRRFASVFAGGYIIDKNDELVDRSLGSYALVYLLDGGGWYSDATGRRQSVARGEVLTLFPDLRHGYGRGTGLRWSEVWVMFRGPLFKELENDGLLDRVDPVRSPGYDTTLVAQFDQIVRDLRDTGPGDSALLAARVHLLLADIRHRHRAHATDRTDADLVAAACAALEQRLTEAVDLHDLARRLGCTYERLRKVFSRRLGMSPSRYRVTRRLDLAKSQLADGATLEQVATRLGYCDQFFFARQFRAITGQSPGAWRRSWRGG
jgi:AraC-like DNA-binding protein